MIDSPQLTLVVEVRTRVRMTVPAYGLTDSPTVDPAEALTVGEIEHQTAEVLSVSRVVAAAD